MSWHRRAADVVHRLTWRRLPRGLRRAALHRTASVLAAWPDLGAQAALPIFVVGYFRTASGLEEAARLCHAACCHLGLDTRSIDISAAHMQPADLNWDREAHASDHHGPGTIIL